MSFANERGLLLKRNRSKWNFQKKTFPRRVTVICLFFNQLAFNFKTLFAKQNYCADVIVNNNPK